MRAWAGVHGRSTYPVMPCTAGHTQTPTTSTRVSTRRLAYAALAAGTFDATRFDSTVLLEGPVAKRGLSGWGKRYAVSDPGNPVTYTSHPLTAHWAVCSCACMQWVHAHAHTSTHTVARVCTWARTDTHACTRARTHTHARAQLPTHKHTCPHTHTHTQVLVPRRLLLLGSRTAAYPHTVLTLEGRPPR